MTLSPELQKQMNEYFGDTAEPSKVKKKKAVDIYKLTEKVRKDFQDEEKYNQNVKEIKHLQKVRTYSGTKSGRVGAGLSKGFRFIQNPTSSIYGRPLPSSRLPITPFQRFRSRIVASSNAAVMQRNQNAAYYDWLFNNWHPGQSGNTAESVEKEISSINGYANAGSFQGRNIDFEAAMLGQNMIVNPVASTSAQARHHSRHQHKNAIKSVSDDVMLFSNLVP